MSDRYRDFASLAAEQCENVDFRIRETWRPKAKAVVIAPHGGSIEWQTSAIAEAIAGMQHSFYTFEGLKKNSNRDLHITSHNFDEPRALKLVAAHKYVVAIHGCAGRGEIALLGGLDKQLVRCASTTIEQHGIECRTVGHAFLGNNRENICNRGRTGAGLQLELTRALRRSGVRSSLVLAVQEALQRVS
ncbi:MAG: poly-gamma-glutamate hydrolase family protein [Steroidobacteraceae bacterium]